MATKIRSTPRISIFVSPPTRICSNPTSNIQLPAMLYSRPHPGMQRANWQCWEHWRGLTRSLLRLRRTGAAVVSDYPGEDVAMAQRLIDEMTSRSGPTRQQYTHRVAKAELLERK
jgi:hypothetical protein